MASADDVILHVCDGGLDDGSGVDPGRGVDHAVAAVEAKHVVVLCKGVDHGCVALVEIYGPEGGSLGEIDMLAL